LTFFWQSATEKLLMFQTSGNPCPPVSELYMGRPDSPDPFIVNPSVSATTADTSDAITSQDARLRLSMGSELIKTLIAVDASLDVCSVISDLVCFDKAEEKMCRWDHVLRQMGFKLDGIRKLVLSLMMNDHTAADAHGIRESRRRKVGVTKY
jgi:hypothetical protein